MTPKAFEYEPILKRTILTNGVRVVTEHHPLSRSVCAGIFLDQGTRDEPDNMVGAAHFVEHMVFKGTETRDAYEIARSLEAVGGDLNAYTSREDTCFHATCLKEDLPLALDVLSDLMSNAQFDVNDFKRERDVILQEIRINDDDVDEILLDRFFDLAFKGHELSRPILGTQKTLQSFTRKKLMDFYLRRYHGRNMVVAVAGHVNHEEVCDILERTLRLRRKPPPAVVRKKPTIRGFARVEKRDVEQVHVLLGLPATSLKDRARFESYLVNAALGGGMTSRLYQKIRERRGLSYTVYSMLQPFMDTGLMLTYAGTSKKHLRQVIGVIMREYESLIKRGLSASELDFYKTQIIGEILLESDDVENRMQTIALNEMVFGAARTVDDVVQDIQSVSTDSIHAFIRKYFDLSKLGMLVMGDINADRTAQYLEELRG